VADHKNSLGQLCFVFCLVLIWDLMETRKGDTKSAIKPEPWTRLVNVGIGLYLLIISSSATSLLCFLFGIVLLVVGKRLAAVKNAHLIFTLGVLAIVTVLALQQTFDLSSKVSEAFGRGAGMSGRSEIWQAALEKHTDYFLGAGFRGFWESSAGKEVFEQLGTGELITVHNGYIETYLNGGVVGLFFLGVFIFSTGLIATTKLVQKEPIGRLAVVFWPLILIYNLTETQFMMAGPVWYAMLLTTIDLRQVLAGRENATVGGPIVRHAHHLRQLSGVSSAMVGAAAAHREIRNREQGLWNSARRQER
jgi:O-antigen ligase